MSKKKKHKKNKKSHVQNSQAVHKVDQSTNLSKDREEIKFLEKEEMVKLENKPVDFLGESTASTVQAEIKLSANNEVSTSDVDLKAESEKVDVDVLGQETKLKHDLQKETVVTLESGAEHHSHTHGSANNFIPFWIGIIVGAVLTFLFL